MRGTNYYEINFKNNLERCKLCRKPMKFTTGWRLKIYSITEIIHTDEMARPAFRSCSSLHRQRGAINVRYAHLEFLVRLPFRRLRFGLVLRQSLH